MLAPEPYSVHKKCVFAARKTRGIFGVIKLRAVAGPREQGDEIPCVSWILKLMEILVVMAFRCKKKEKRSRGRRSGRRRKKERGGKKGLGPDEQSPSFFCGISPRGEFLHAKTERKKERLVNFHAPPVAKTFFSRRGS